MNILYISLEAQKILFVIRVASIDRGDELNRHHK